MTRKISSTGGVGPYDPKKKPPFPPNIKSMTVSEVAEDLAYRRSLKKEGKKTMPATAPPLSTALIRPGDITDAIDSRDLLTSLMDQNKSRVQGKVDARLAKQWLDDALKNRRERYMRDAKQAYEKIYAVCVESPVGHNFRMIEVMGYNINQCDDCGFCTNSTPGDSTAGQVSRELSRANDMMDTRNKALADRMIELDIEAQIIEPLKIEDYPGPLMPPREEKKKGLFSR